jgi:hypothetical protein
MKKFFLCFFAVFLMNSITVVGAKATPIEFNQNSNNLTSNNVWENGEVYSFLGDGIDLAAGQYNLTFSINGKVWQKGDGNGWETSDKIIVEAFLNDSLLGSTTGSGLHGQKKPFDLSLALNFDLSTDGILAIYTYSDVSSKKERWFLANASLNGTNIGHNYGENPVPTPEPASILLLGSGLIGLLGYSRKKFFKK